MPLQSPPFLPRYTLRQLKYFVITAEVLSFTAASRLLHISQPSVSSALADLEESFGVQLFIRHHASGLSLTRAGKDLLVLARNLLRIAEELQDVASDLNGGTKGHLALGCLITLAPYLLPRVMSHFKAVHKAIVFETIATHQQRLIDGLHDGSIDVALTYNLDLPQDIVFDPLVDLPPYVILPGQHSLANNAVVALEDLANEPYILLDLPHSREYFVSLFNSVGCPLTPAFSSPQPEVIRGMVANGLGYSIQNFPITSNTTVDGNSFAVCALSGNPRPMVLGTMRLRSVRPRKAVHLLEAFCRQQFAAAPRPGERCTSDDAAPAE